MLQALKLLLPALIPSWRFFDAIAPSPRIEFALLQNAQETPVFWREYRPRPALVSLPDMLKRMLWNAEWNEYLFLVSCAERLINNPADHSLEEIFKRIAADVRRGPADVSAPMMQFRLVFVSRAGAGLERDIRFISPVREWGDGHGV
jgi:hypothetical protein